MKAGIVKWGWQQPRLDGSPNPKGTIPAGAAVDSGVVRRRAGKESVAEPFPVVVER